MSGTPYDPEELERLAAHLAAERKKKKGERGEPKRANKKIKKQPSNAVDYPASSLTCAASTLTRGLGELPVDVLFQVYGYAAPLALCRTACVSKSSRAFLESSQATFDYWRSQYRQKFMATPLGDAGARPKHDGDSDLETYGCSDLLMYMELQAWERIGGSETGGSTITGKASKKQKSKSLQAKVVVTGAGAGGGSTAAGTADWRKLYALRTLAVRSIEGKKSGRAYGSCPLTLCPLLGCNTVIRTPTQRAKHIAGHNTLAESLKDGNRPDTMLVAVCHSGDDFCNFDSMLKAKERRQKSKAREIESRRKRKKQKQSSENSSGDSSTGSSSTSSGSSTSSSSSSSSSSGGAAGAEQQGGPTGNLIVNGWAFA